MSGNKDFMQSLEHLTGVITTVEEDVFNDTLSKVGKHQSGLLKAIDTLLEMNPNKELESMKNTIIDYDLPANAWTTRYKKGKKPRRILRWSIKEIINSDYFRVLQKLEESVHDYLTNLFGSKNDSNDILLTATDIKVNQYKWESIMEKYNANPILRSTVTILDYQVSNKTQYQQFQFIQLHAATMIELIFRPQYNIRKKIESSPEYLEAVIVKSDEMIRKDPDYEPSDSDDLYETVMHLVIKFVIIKFRVDMTGNNKFYVHMLNSNEIMTMSSSRLLQFMKSINMSACTGRENIIQLSDAIKETLKALNEGKQVSQEHLQIATLGLHQKTESKHLEGDQGMECADLLG